jgi:zinc protease
MKRFISLLILISLPALGICASAYAQSCSLVDLRRVEVELRQRTHQITLANGLQVVLFEDHNSPFAAVRTVFNVGSRQESPGQEGFAHLFEHLMFKGTKNIPEGGYRQIVGGLGGDLWGGGVNAKTMFDYTQYTSLVPSENIQGALWLEADRFQNLQIRQKDLSLEINTVLEEKKQRVDNQPYLKAVNDFVPTLGAGTPYTHSPIGNEASLSAANLKKVQDFLQRYYSAKNAALAVAGDIEPGPLKGFIKNTFAGLRSGERSPGAEQSRMAFSEPYTLLYDHLAPYPVYVFIWPTVGELHPEYVLHRVTRSIVLDALDDAMDREQLAFLTLPPVYNEDLNHIKYAGFTVFLVIPRISAGRRQVERLVEESIASLLKDKNYDVCAKLQSVERQMLSEFRDNADIAYRLSADLMDYGDPLHVLNQLEQLRQIKPEDIESVIRRYYLHKSLLIEVSPKGATRWAKRVGEIVPDFLMRPLEDKIIEIFDNSDSDL